MEEETVHSQPFLQCMRKCVSCWSWDTRICFTWNCLPDSLSRRSCKLQYHFCHQLYCQLTKLWVCVIKMLDGQSRPPYGLLYTAWWTLMSIYEHFPVHLSVTAYFIQPLQYCNAMQTSYLMMDTMWLWFMLCVMSANIRNYNNLSIYTQQM